LNRRPVTASISRRLRLLSVACALTLICVGAPVLAAEVRGQVFDSSGEPLAGVTVAVFETEGGGRSVFGGSEPAPEPTRVASTQTNEQGLYTIELGARQFGGDVFVRCVGGPGWDDLRYALPKPRDVTRELRDGKDVSATFRVRDAPGWHELQREIQRAGGPNSKRGKILRRRGLPPETLTTVEGRVEWRYPGVTFVFEGEELVDIQREPSRASGRRASGEGV
jgi:hypothetical protein